MKSKINKTFVVVMFIWVVITLLRVLFHQTWYDEVHAYMMAKELSFLDIIAQMKYEGHTFIWYMILMPFAKADLWYPYPMLFLNWLFAFIALIIFWKKAPFNNFTKTIVTFSYPFLAQLPVIARCYAIGVMFLFMLCALYKNSLKHPLWYSCLIILCANTSVMALYGAAAFGFIFAYDLIKGALNGVVSKKDFRISFIVMAIGAVLIMWQLGGANSVYLGCNTEFIAHFMEFIINNNLLLDVSTIILIVISMFFYPFYFWKNKKVFFFGVFTIGGLLITFITKYAGWTHHYVFFWIYLLISVWLMNFSSEKWQKLKNIAEVIITLLFFVLIFNHISFSMNYFHSASKFLADTIFDDARLANSRIILYNWADTRILPYIKSSDSDIRFYCTGEKPNSDASLNLGLVCDFDREGGIYPLWLNKSFDKNKKSYIILPIEDDISVNGFSVEDRTFKMNFEPYKIINKTYGIFEIRKIKK